MGGKLRDIALIYAAYDARLRSGDFDARSRLQKLREHLEGSGYLRGCDVYLDGFSYFNRQEESILELVLRQAESVTVTLLGDRSSDRLFQNALRQRMRLERMARRAGQEMDVLWCESRGQGPLGHLEAHFFGQEVPYDGEPEGLELYQAATAFTEVEWVSQQLRQLAAEGMTMLVVTHELSFARNVSTRTVFMENGLVVEEGPSKELFDRPQQARTREFLAGLQGQCIE